MPERTRREPRYPVALPAVVTVGGVAVDSITHDCSFEGISVEARGPEPTALKLGQLARVMLLVPSMQKPLQVSASVVHTSRRKRSSAAGLRFYGMAGQDRAAWDRFIGHLRDEFPVMSGRAVRLPRGEHFEPKLYRSAHQVAVLRIYVGSVADLYALAEPEVESTFVLTDERVRVGDEVGLQVVHPDSEGIFEIAAFVRRIVDQHGIRGLDLELLDLDADRRARLREFIDDGLEALFDEETLVDETDPSAADPST